MLAKGLVKRGAFIVLEGCDRSGKSTQCGRLVHRLCAEGHKVVSMRFPDRTTAIGKMINSYLTCATELDDRAIHLLFSANRWECRSRILSLLEQGTSIVCDRYCFSGVAFSASKDELDMEWCKTPDAGLPAPDVVYFLDLAVEEAAKRGDFGDERYEREAMQRKVRQNFHMLKQENWKMIDALQSVDEIHDFLYSEATKVINQSAAGVQPLSTLTWAQQKPHTTETVNAASSVALESETQQSVD